MFESLPCVHKFDLQLPVGVVVSKFLQFLDSLEEGVLHGEAVHLDGIGGYGDVTG